MEDTTSLWNKKPDDMTVGDSVKVGVGVTIVCTVVPLVIFGGAAYAMERYEKIQAKREAKKAAHKA